MLDQKMARVTGRQVPTPLTSGGAQVLGLIIKDLPTDYADEATFFRRLLKVFLGFNYSNDVLTL